MNLRVDYAYDAWGDRVATSTDVDGDGYVAPVGDQWASTALGASYGYPGTGGYSAAQAVGAPDVSTYGFNGNAWLSYPNATTGYLLLGFAKPAYADGVNVVESNNNGHVTEVDLIYADSTTTAVSVTDSTPTAGVHTLNVPFTTTSKRVTAVKIVVDDTSSAGYSQIDAVELLTPNTVLSETAIGSTDQSPATTYYVQDGWDPMKPSGVGTANVDVRMDLDGSGSLTTRYMRNDQVDEMVGRVDYTGGGTTASAKWYVLDRQDSIAQVLDGRGQVLDALTYDAYGNILTETDRTQRGRYAWTGRELDAETELQYNRARWYDPTVGRWISQDPMGFAAGDSNLYRYVKNAPTNGDDPSGHRIVCYTTRGAPPKYAYVPDNIPDTTDAVRNYLFPNPIDDPQFLLAPVSDPAKNLIDLYGKTPGDQKRLASMLNNNFSGKTSGYTLKALVIDMQSISKLQPGELCHMPDNTIWTNADAKIKEIVEVYVKKNGKIPWLVLGGHSGVEGITYVSPQQQLSAGDLGKMAKAKQDQGEQAFLYITLKRPFDMLDFYKKNMADGGKITFAQCGKPGAKTDALRSELVKFLGDGITVELWSESGGFYYGFPYPQLSVSQRVGIRLGGHGSNAPISRTGSK